MLLSNVFIGTTANDSTGETLRAAFETINLNFANITAAGNAIVGVSSVAGRAGDVVLTVNDVRGAASMAYISSLLFTSGNSVIDLTTVNATIVAANTAVVSYVNAYETWANAAIYVLGNNQDAYQSYVSAYEIRSDANVTAANAAISSTNANVGAYETWANASISSTNANVTATNAAIVTAQVAAIAADSIVPMVSKSLDYTLTLVDEGVLHPSTDVTARTFTIDSNANVAYPLYKVLVFVNQTGAGVVTISINGDTMRLAGAGTTGNRTLAADGLATAFKIAATEWIISGAGLA